MSRLTGIRARRDAIAALLGAQSTGRIGWSYALRIICAATTSFLACRLLRIDNPVWAVVSSVVVILPGHRASVASAALRVIANMVGAGVGAGIASLGLPPLAAITLGLLLVAGVCRLLAIDAAARSASVALVIVLVRDPRAVVGSSETRVAQVMLGCAAAFVVTIVAAWIERAPGARRP